MPSSAALLAFDITYTQCGNFKNLHFLTHFFLKKKNRESNVVQKKKYRVNFKNYVFFESDFLIFQHCFTCNAAKLSYENALSRFTKKNPFFQEFHF